PTPATALYTLSLHDALPIFAELHHLVGVYGDLFRHFDDARTRRVVSLRHERRVRLDVLVRQLDEPRDERLRTDHRLLVAGEPSRDRKSTRLNSSHLGISYAV